MVTDEQKSEFEEKGYLVVEHVLRGELLDEVRRASQALADAEPPGVDRRVWHERALFRRPAFRKVLDVPELVETARGLIGEDVQLLAMDLLFVRAGRENVGWHRDVQFVCDKTLSVNTGIYLQDLTEAN